MPSPREMAEQDRLAAIARGDQLYGEGRQRGTNEQDLRNYYRYRGDEEADRLLGSGGYSPEETADIRRQDELDSLRFTPEEEAAGYLTEGEQAGITGDPYRFYRPEYLDAIQEGSQANQRAAVQQMRGGMYDSITPDLQMSGDYATNTAGTLNATDEGVAGSIAGTEGRVRGAIDRDLLAQDEGAAGRVRMTDEEQQDVVTGAGISAGTGYRASIGALERQARAAGTNPMGVAAYRARAEREAAGEAGDAMTQARIAASREAAAREMGLEQNRQGAEQFIAAETAGNEQQLGQARVGATERAGSRRLGAIEGVEDRRTAGVRDVSDRRMSAAVEGGRAALGSEQAINQQQTSGARYNQEAGMGAEQEAATRARDLGTNRQATAQYSSGQRYGRGMDISQASSQRASQVAGARREDAQEGRRWIAGQSDTANRNAQTEYDRQGDTYRSQNAAAQNATGNAIQADRTPRWWERAIGAGAGAAKAGAEVAAAFARGGVVTEPTYALIGEEGPEAVVPLDGRQDARVKPSDVGYRAQGDRMAASRVYGGPQDMAAEPLYAAQQPTPKRPPENPYRGRIDRTWDQQEKTRRAGPRYYGMEAA